MPAFFLVYGMVASTKSIRSKNDVLHFIRKKICSLVVPYFLWAMIYAPSINTNFFKGILWGTNPSLGAAQTNQVLWFLPTMFLATIFFQIIVELINLCSQSKFRLILCGIFIILCGCISLLLKNKGGSLGWLFNLDISFTGTLFILIGYLLKNIFDRLYSKPSYIILLLGFVCLCSGFLLAQFNAPQNAGLPYWLWLFMEDPIHLLYLCRFSILLPFVVFLFYQKN